VLRFLDVCLGLSDRMKTSDIPALTASARFRVHNAELLSVGTPPDNDRSSRYASPVTHDFETTD
jgi:hypothetical protein